MTKSTTNLDEFLNEKVVIFFGDVDRPSFRSTEVREERDGKCKVFDGYILSGGGEEVGKLSGWGDPDGYCFFDISGKFGEIVSSDFLEQFDANRFYVRSTILGGDFPWNSYMKARKRYVSWLKSPRKGESRQDAFKRLGERGIRSFNEKERRASKAAERDNVKTFISPPSPKINLGEKMRAA